MEVILNYATMKIDMKKIKLIKAINLMYYKSKGHCHPDLSLYDNWMKDTNNTEGLQNHRHKLPSALHHHIHESKAVWGVNRDRQQDN